MFRIALIGMISVVLLLAAGSMALARGVNPTNGIYDHALNVTSQVGSMHTGDTTTPGVTTTMPGSGATMASHFAQAVDQMRTRASQMEAATHMQPATGMDPGNGMQTGSMGTGTGYTDPGSMGSTTSTGTMGTSTGSGAMMGTTGTGTTNTSGSSGSMMRR